MGGTDFFDNDLVQRRGALKGSSVGPVATESGSAVKRDDFPARPIADLNLTRMARHREEVNTQMATAKVDIERMRRKQSELEREKQTMEEMLEKQDQYERGKQELLDKLSESVVSLQKLEDHAARQVEIYSAARARFSEVLDEIQRINDADWSDETLRDELNRAVVTIDTARKEFVKVQAAVESVGGPVTLFDASRPRAASGVDEDEAAPRTFGQWIKIGLAVSLPLMVTLAIVIAVLLMRGM
jgi:chromosome segregation ATPase